MPRIKFIIVSKIIGINIDLGGSKFFLCSKSDSKLELAPLLPATAKLSIRSSFSRLDIIIGNKYTAVKNEPPIRTTAYVINCPSKAPITKWDLLTKPFNGGIPIRLKVATVKHPIVIGILRPIPSISLKLVFPVIWMIVPIQKNRLIFIKAWFIICKRPPLMEFSVKITRPIIM